MARRGTGRGSGRSICRTAWGGASGWWPRGGAGLSGTPGRLGQLYLQDGVWEGERLLPEGWSRFVGNPAPAWEQPIYGGQFWVNGTGEWALPRDAYMMAGSGQQRVFIVPSVDLIIVRMGHVCAHGTAARSINAMLERITKTLGSCM